MLHPFKGCLPASLAAFSRQTSGAVRWDSPGSLKKSRLLIRWFPLQNTFTDIGDSFTVYPEYMIGILLPVSRFIAIISMVLTDIPLCGTVYA